VTPKRKVAHRLAIAALGSLLLVSTQVPRGFARLGGSPQELDAVSPLLAHAGAHDSTSSNGVAPVPAASVRTGIEGKADQGHGGPNCTTPETWQEVGVDYFPLPIGLFRSQGVATDGTSWLFSYQLGLERTNDAYIEQASNPYAIPPEIASNGGNHIGDVDYFNGKLFAPIEDGNLDPLFAPEYDHPYIALFDAQTLLYTGVRYELPVDIHLAGVPWVAINSKNKKTEVYTAEWDMPNDRINVFDLDMNFRRFIFLHGSDPADPHLSRIQGAKMFNGFLYASRDDDFKSIYKIDLKTGNYTKLFSIFPTDAGKPQAEAEGLAFRETTDGAQMHVIMIHDNKDYTKIRSSLHHFKLVSSCDG
jgi:hypothetical protein